MYVPNGSICSVIKQYPNREISEKAAVVAIEAKEGSSDDIW